MFVFLDYINHISYDHKKTKKLNLIVFKIKTAKYNYSYK